MGGKSAKPTEEMPGRHGVQDTGAPSAGPLASAHAPVAKTLAEHAETSREGMEAGAITPRIEVHLPSEAGGSDEVIAERVLQALFSDAPLRRERIRLRIVRGRITLSGTVGTEAERVTIEQLVAGIEGVADITNLVAVEQYGRTTAANHGVAEAYGGDAESGDVAGRIEAVFVRQAGLGATEVMITAAGGKVVLSGHVHSWRERDLAERIAWATPGVTEVLDRITVR
jgi:osmotically-inducible protein OsmY